MYRVCIFLALILSLISCRTQPGETSLKERLPQPQVSGEGVKAVISDYPVQPSVDKPEELLDQYISRLSLRQKIGQKFITWIPGTVISAEAERLISEGYIGGVILYDYNIADSLQLKTLTAALQDYARRNKPAMDLWIGIDQEGGRVRRIQFKNSTSFSAPHFWAKYEDPRYIEAAAYILNREILELGCNLNFAPVLDLYGNDDRTIIGDRSLGSDSSIVGQLGTSYLKGAKDAGIIPVAKHFPGHGLTMVDSHFELPVVAATEEYLINNDLVPFKMAIESGVDMIMTAHVLYKEIDPVYPATLSRAILTGLLRERMGFEGVIISDQISMGALTNNFSIREIIKN
ncbi:MAG: hypothetical protein GH155_01350, partial [Spirochaeta sp.]|nr:hypothetical protein [Spirochaeta sp.]